PEERCPRRPRDRPSQEGLPPRLPPAGCSPGPRRARAGRSRRRERQGWPVGPSSPAPLRGLLAIRTPCYAETLPPRRRAAVMAGGAPIGGRAGDRVIPRYENGTTRRTASPAHGNGKRARKPFGPDPSRRRRARSSVVYWASGPVPGPTPRPVGVPRLDGPTAL